MEKPESWSTFSTGGMHSLKSGRHNSSNFALVMLILKSMDSAKESTSIIVYVEEDKILLAFSHWFLNRLKALLFLEISIPYF